MATQFAYIPATSDGCTVHDCGPKPIAIPIRAEEAPWQWLAWPSAERVAALADDAEPAQVSA